MNRYILGEKMYGILDEMFVAYLQKIIRDEQESTFTHYEDKVHSKQIVAACYTLLDHFCVRDEMKRIVSELETSASGVEDLESEDENKST